MKRSLLTLLALLLPACGNDAQLLQELRVGQREIRARLTELEKKLDRVAAVPAMPRAAQHTPDANRVYELPVGSSPSKGVADAAVVITEFSDFQCPFCSRVPAVIEQVLNAYPSAVKFVYKEFPLTSIHPDAMNASLAAQAAHRQGKFWEMHDLLFANQRALKPADLSNYAAQIGLDVERFERDMKSATVKERVAADMTLARNSDVRGTPTLFVNGKRVKDRSVEGLKAMVAEALEG
jgi:protein-disulfide isomerase